MAERYGLRQGWSLDLTEVDENGDPWDLSLPERQNKVLDIIDRDKPGIVIVCPPCGPFSSWQYINYKIMSDEAITKRLEAGIAHLAFAALICRKQATEGRHYLFEHPATATSWSTRVMKSVTSIDGNFTVDFDFCMAGMKSKDERGTGAAKKRTRLATNCKEVAE